MSAWNKGLKGFNRPLRQARYRDLLALGFSVGESRVLSAMPRNIPYLKQMAVARYAEYARFLKRGKTESEWQTHILRRYNAKGWTRGRAKSESSVWNMLRTWEHPYKQAHPEYVQHYPKHSHHKDSERTKGKLISKSDSIADLRYAIKTFRHGKDDPQLLKIWQAEIDKQRSE